jgi:hypothetical protein
MDNPVRIFGGVYSDSAHSVATHLEGFSQLVLSFSQ